MTRETNISATSRRSIAIPILLQLAVLAVVAVCAFSPTTWLWGINHLGYYPKHIRAAALAVVLLTFVPVISRWIYGGLLRVVEQLTASTRRGVFLRMAVAVSALVLFIGFPSATVLLGDGELQSDLWGDAARQGQSFRTFLGVVQGNIQQTFALGTDIVSFAVAKASTAAGYTNPVGAILIFFALLGAVLIFSLLNFLKRRAFAPEFALVVVTAFVLSGAMQLFFGYVEVYAPMTVATVFYLMAASVTLRTGQRPWLPPTLLALAVFLHAQALLLIPSVVALGLGYAYRKRSTRHVRRLGAVLIAVSVAGAIALSIVPLASRFFLPFTSTESAHGVISIRHVLDMANVLLLIFPMGILVFGVGLAPRLAATGIESAQTADDAWATAFHRSLAMAGVLFLLLFHPDLGMANDWDLYIVPILCLAVPALRNCKERINGIDRVNAARMIVPAMALSALITVSWLGINANESRSVKRYQEVIANDKMSGAYGLEILGSYYKDRGDVHAEIGALERAVSISPNPRYRFVLGLRYYHIGEKERAVETLYRCLTSRPDYDEARKFLVQMLFFMKRYEELIEVAAEGARQRPDDPFYPFCIGKAHLAEGRVDDALAAFEQCKGLRMPPEIESELARLLESLGSRP